MEGGAVITENSSLHHLFQMEGGDVITENSSLRAGDLSKRNLLISITRGTELAGTSLTGLVFI